MKKGCNAFDDMDCSTSKPVEDFNCSSNNRGQRDLTLGALVSYYIDEHRDRMKRYFRYYGQQTLNDAIRIAALYYLVENVMDTKAEENNLHLMNRQGDSWMFKIKSKCVETLKV